ncbi:MAG: M3 family oligoendopeptidase [Myxococcales bacterium]|nr:M3 family oligoendopeptidase [Myxococcales bacterium]
MNTADHAGDWDLTPFFPGLDSPAYNGFIDALRRDLGALSVPQAATAAQTAQALVTLQDLEARLEQARSYVGCLCSQGTNPPAVAASAQVDALGVLLEKCWIDVRCALVALPADELATMLARPELAPVAYYVKRAWQKAGQTMAPALEGLAADLSPSSLTGWSRLYDRISGSLTFEMVTGGKATRQPVAMTRTFLEDADPATRRAAFDGSNAAWDSVAESCNAALNAIAGTRLTLYKRRGIDDFLAPALHGAGIARATLEAMMGAVRDRQDVPRRYLTAKAKKLGLAKLGFWDLMAALPQPGAERLPIEGAWQRIHQAFARVPELASMAQTAQRERWVDWQTRDGKRPGGYCTGFPLNQTTRIFMTYHGALGDVQTLAHELGHSFHNWVMRDQPYWATQYPMTLAETASTFAEELVCDALLASGELSPAAREAMIDTRLEACSAFMLNIPVRFDFECEFYRQRASGELSVAQTKALMSDAQRKNYGDTLGEDGLDPLFWASKLHFYIPDLSFYNFPYTFGYLFSKGLYARFAAQGPSFIPDYIKMLRATGRAPAEVVAKETLGIDLTTPAFWHSAIDLIERELEAYCGN